MAEYTDEEKDDAYQEYLRSHPAYDHAMTRVLNWINSYDGKEIHRKELYHTIMDMRGTSNAR